MNGTEHSAATRLATYGTLAPGRANHGQLEDLAGVWSTGTVRGTLVEAGWGAAMGFPGLRLGDDGAEIEVHLFESHDLPRHWDRLDAFEGAGYERVTVSVTKGNSQVLASIYVVLQENAEGAADE